MGGAYGDNFKGFVMSRPPLIMFVTVISLFAVILMSLAYYVKFTEKVQNPDISEDWNLFLENFASLEFCIVNNHSDMTTAGQPTTTMSAPSTTQNTSTLPQDGLKNFSVGMLLTIHPTRDFISIPHNLTFLTGSFLGSQIGLKGIAGEEMINVTMTLPVEWNTTHCGNLQCDTVQLYTCVYFQAQQNVFPTSRSPRVCEIVNDTGIEYHAKVMAQHHAVNMFPPYYCKSKPVIRVEYNLDPALTVYLSLNDRSVINLHLLHTSYFLFVMVVTILLYAVIRGKPLSKMVNHQHLLSHTDT